MRLLPSWIGLSRFNLSKFSIIICFIHQYPDRCRSNLAPGLDRLFESRCKSRPGEPTTARTNVYTYLCIHANRLKHVRTFLIGYRSGGTPYILRNLRRVLDCGPLTRKQCLPAPRRPPGSSCCLLLLAGGFRPTTTCQLILCFMQGQNTFCP